MGRHKRRNEEWHHRVPDFKLVYCGTKKKAHDNEKTGHISDVIKLRRKKKTEKRKAIILQKH